jgi:hypothetical protein
MTTSDQHQYGTAGSLIMTCRACGREHFRDAHKVLVLKHQEYCVWCSGELTPTRKDEGDDDDD